MEDLPPHPLSGSVTGKYLTSDDGSVKVAAHVTEMSDHSEVRRDMEAYKWKDSDFLLATYPKNGTHFMWETMMMLLNGSADYIRASKAVFMVDSSPVAKIDKIFPSPRVLNTHYRMDVLPKEFRKAKTVLFMRNPKDTCVSYYYHFKNIKVSVKKEPEAFENMTLGQFMKMFLYDKDMPYGTYFDYVEYMWSLRDDPNILILFYEDLKTDPIAIIQKVNEFMGTNGSPELVKDIAEAINFDKMKIGKTTGPPSTEMVEMIKCQTPNAEKVLEIIRVATKAILRKGDVGDWKNHLTVAQNEWFDSFLADWKVGQDIPFKYSQQGSL
ncbi:sulfotransferase 1E1-like [Watersipora subatra]|uniref:sulfotransferase 1E1-like n=1 Tax=Watersipora subatra TaxID=2589382 RepID=UPI00355B27F3